MKEDISRYVGIKHYFGESSFEKCDCFGLVKLFYREHGWPQTFTDDNPEPVTEANYAQPRMWRRLYKYMLTHFERVTYDDLQFGDVVIMQVNLCMHMGIYVGYEMTFYVLSEHTKKEYQAFLLDTPFILIP